SQFGPALSARFPDGEPRHVHAAGNHMDLLGRHPETPLENLPEWPRKHDERARAAVHGPLDRGLREDGEPRLALRTALQPPRPLEMDYHRVACDRVEYGRGIQREVGDDQQPGIA